MTGCAPRGRSSAPRIPASTWRSARLTEAELEGERLTEDEVVGFFQLLLLAGSETTTNLIGNAVLSFFEHPGELARLRGDPALLAPAIEELLRFRAPVQTVFRAARREVALGGQQIPEGALVFAMIGAANRDPAAFAAPERLDIGRAPNPHLAFGHGVHFCLGAALARLEARIALPALLARLPGLAPVADEPWQPRRAFHVNGPSQLPVRFTAT